MSRLSDLFESIIAAFQAAGSDTKILIGERYLDDNEGTANRIVFVPEDADPVMAPNRIGTNPNTGKHGFAKIDYGCSAYCWGIESYPEVDDLTRYKKAEEIEELLLSALDDVATGRVTLKKIRRTKAGVATYGEEFVVEFSFLAEKVKGAANLAPLPANLKSKVSATVQSGG